MPALVEAPAPKPGRADSGPEREPPALAVAMKAAQGRAYGTRVLASGRGALAEQILEVARAYGVAIHSDADLAEVLSAIEIDSEIPLSALTAVAEILSYLYRNQDEALAKEQIQEANP